MIAKMFPNLGPTLWIIVGTNDLILFALCGNSSILINHRCICIHALLSLEIWRHERNRKVPRDDETTDWRGFGADKV